MTGLQLVTLERWTPKPSAYPKLLQFPLGRLQRRSWIQLPCFPAGVHRWSMDCQAQTNHLNLYWHFFSLSHYSNVVWTSLEVSEPKFGHFHCIASKGNSKLDLNPEFCRCYLKVDATALRRCLVENYFDDAYIVGLSRKKFNYQAHILE